ncbi:winged helix-turn-helix domain-containing protein [Telmatospirillum sp.]|uniref:winged helix-turn-helix domain-containing protein n=1 Tax=Telmatospirillum sp. TaxID=2079197 RepID=UPI0028474504|nr:winged helix-turn-helix domain-containing protein [Telmatospirillum sp.]MDR3440980.1 winged helix-turn-helix domain-containing protein [Telmatospirillum sp.]
MPRKIRPRLRFKLGSIILLGPGKTDLLQAIDRTGSISAAARSMGMSYKRAWQLVDEMNRHLDAPVVAASFGGSHGGGAHLTAFGHEVLACYRRMLATLETALADDMAWLDQHTVCSDETDQ